MRKKCGVDSVGIHKLCVEFFEFFDNKYSKKRWVYFLKNIKKIPENVMSYMTPAGIKNKFILDYMKENFVFEETYESSKWFHNPLTKKQIRISDWLLEKKLSNIPDNFIPGRIYFGANSNKNKRKINNV